MRPPVRGPGRPAKSRSARARAPRRAAFEDRQRWQRDFVAALRQERKPEELGRRLAEMFDKPELRRSEEFIREDRAGTMTWDNSSWISTCRSLRGSVRRSSGAFPTTPRISPFSPEEERGHLSPRHATRVFLSLATLAGLVLSPGAARAAGGELKAWGGGATPSLALRDLQGKEHKLADYRGKVVVINFWAHLVRSLPRGDALDAAAAGQARRQALRDPRGGLRRGRAADQRVPEKSRCASRCSWIATPSAATAWKVKVLPTTLVLDPQQRIRYSVTGDLEWDSQSVEDTIKKLLSPELRYAPDRSSATCGRGRFRSRLSALGFVRFRRTACR